MLETSLTFPMCAERMASSAAACEALLAETDDHEVPADIIGDFAAQVGSSMSGIGLWPRLIMDDEDKLKVETRGSDGSPRKSCWELVFPLLCSSPESVAPGDNLRVDATITLGASVDDPVTYDLQACIESPMQGVVTPLSDPLVDVGEPAEAASGTQP